MLSALAFLHTNLISRPALSLFPCKAQLNGCLPTECQPTSLQLGLYPRLLSPLALILIRILCEEPKLSPDQSAFSEILLDPIHKLYV